MYIFWVISGIIFLILDTHKKNNVFLSLSCAFLFSAIVSYKIPSKEYLSLVLAPVFYLVFYFLITKTLNKEKQDYKKDCNLKNFIGKTATVTKDIGKTLSIDGIGQIEFENNFWSAKNIIDKEIKAGTKVEIVSKENMIMNVKVQ